MGKETGLIARVAWAVGTHTRPFKPPGSPTIPTAWFHRTLVPCKTPPDSRRLGNKLARGGLLLGQAKSLSDHERVSWQKESF